VTGQILAELESGEDGIRILGLQTCALGPVADDDLAAGPGHAQEGVDILLDGHSPHISGDRPAQLQETLAARLEQVGVDAAAPTGEIVESMGRQLLAHVRGADHATHGGAMKAAQRRVGSV